MLELLLVSVALPMGMGALLSFVIEQGLRPAPLLRGRLLPAYVAHLGVWMLAFALVFAVTQRPWFSALLVLAELQFVVLVSNAKQHSLREPFVFADVEYFIDALRHPRLFLPYLGVWRTFAICGLFAAVLYLGLALEPAFPGRSGYGFFCAVIAILLVSGAAMLWMGTPQPAVVTFNAVEDLRRCGLPACLWYYAVAERVQMDVSAHSPFMRTRLSPAAENLPHLVVVQSESFFDVRRLYPEIRPELLGQFDVMCRSALQYGRVQVPAWGGNTTRSEFAFLSGLTAAQLGVHRFNPHRRLARRSLPNLAGFLKSAGYRTVCVHPYPVGFNSRDVVYPALGFDEFVDLERFGGAERCGPYVSDQAVAEQVCSLLAGATRPLLLFVITMENHGPLHLERPTPEDVNRLYKTPPLVGFDDLTVYLRHLANADRMIGQLKDCIARTSRDGLLCWYGDHVPILPDVYQKSGFVDGRTDYFIWRKGAGLQQSTRVDLSVESLGGLLLDRAGFTIKPL